MLSCQHAYRSLFICCTFLHHPSADLPTCRPANMPTPTCLQTCLPTCLPAYLHVGTLCINLYVIKPKFRVVDLVGDCAILPIRVMKSPYLVTIITFIQYFNCFSLFQQTGYRINECYIIVTCITYTANKPD